MTTGVGDKSGELTFFFVVWHMKDDKTNPLVGADSRAELLQRLGSALEQNPKYFSNGDGGSIRPGYLVDFLFSRADGEGEVSVHDLWGAIMYGLEAIWPSGRTTINRKNMGDVWPHSSLPKTADDASSGYVPFHKLSQWLGYSLLEPIQDAGEWGSCLLSLQCCYCRCCSLPIFSFHLTWGWGRLDGHRDTSHDGFTRVPKWGAICGSWSPFSEGRIYPHQPSATGVRSDCRVAGPYSHAAGR